MRDAVDSQPAAQDANADQAADETMDQAADQSQSQFPKQSANQFPNQAARESDSMESPGPDAADREPISEFMQETVSTARSLAEWITFAIASLVLIALIGLVVYDWVVNQDRPPAFQVEVTESARITNGRYYVPFMITNTGGRIARTVQVTAELHIAGELDETGEQQIDFLSGQERKGGSFIFTHNPQEGELVLRVASYRLP
jgi:uncharacterized protein (TIGR02588 family)